MEHNQTVSRTFDKIVKIHNASSEPWYDLLAPFQITYEYCSGVSSEDFCNILMVSPADTNYRRIPFCNFSDFNTRPAHKHNYFELLLVLKGNTIQKIEGKEFMYPAGSCCLINRNLSHTEKFTEETKLLFIGLSTDFITELLNLHKTSYFHQERECGENFILKFMQTNLCSDEKKSYLDLFPRHQNQNNLSKTLWQLSESLIQSTLFPQFGSTYMIKGLICALLQNLGSESAYHHIPVNLDLGTEMLIFSRVTHLLEDTDGRLSRSELEEILNYNGSYLNAIVKRHTGMCLFDYGMTFCLKKAALLLSETDESISSIIAGLSFTNRTHFYKLFHEKYGLTPKEYRNNHREYPNSPNK